MRILVTGGSGFIGSVLVGNLLNARHMVTVVDDLWWGGESMLPYMMFDNFKFYKKDVCIDALDDLVQDQDVVIHLAAIVGYPACDKEGRDRVWRVNVEGTQNVYRAARMAGVKRFIFTSSYSVYGESGNGELVTEDSELRPKSLYAESKIAAEKFLLEQDDTVVLRLATVFGLSPRTRFDLIVNQFVLEARSKGILDLYQAEFRRSFVHVRDVAKAIVNVVEYPNNSIHGQVFNVGDEPLNVSKQEIADMIKEYMPKLEIRHHHGQYESDMRDIHVGYDKIKRVFGFMVHYGIEDGIKELLRALREGWIRDPFSDKYRNYVKEG